jgi:magnesium transporter
MLRILRVGATAFETPECEPGLRIPDDAVWLDLVQPSRTEEQRVEAALDLQLPTPEDMAEIERSSRLYQEGGATFLTAVVLTASDAVLPQTEPITFVLAGGRLITIRHVEPRSFALFSSQTVKQPWLHQTGATTFLNLLEAVVDRAADILERTSADVETVNQAVFADPRPRSFDACLAKLGRTQNINAKIRDSLGSLARLISFAGLASEIEGHPDHKEQLASLSQDVQSLVDHSGSISTNVGFLFDAALGFVNIEQSEISRRFSVVAVVFLPPTLVASTYGMNFDHMPELHWLAGYPWALGLMATSVIVSLLIFHRHRWL